MRNANFQRCLKRDAGVRTVNFTMNEARELLDGPFLVIGDAVIRALSLFIFKVNRFLACESVKELSTRWKTSVECDLGLLPGSDRTSTRPKLDRLSRRRHQRRCPRARELVLSLRPDLEAGCPRVRSSSGRSRERRGRRLGPARKLLQGSPEPGA